MRISEERHEARLRVSRLDVAIAEAIYEVNERMEDKLTSAEVSLALAQFQNRYAEAAFCKETEASMKRANK